MPQVPASWRDRLAVLGVAACGVLAARAARVLWLRACLSLGPVRVRKYKWQFALVTGASEGIGKAIATSLAKHGMNVVLVSRSQAKLDAAQKEIQALYPDVQVRTMSCDLTKAEECRGLLKRLEGTNITCLVANAGGGANTRGFAHYWSYTDEEEAYVHGLNGVSCTTLVRGLLPGMIERGCGAVVAISSIMSKWGAMAVPYGGEKARLNAIMTSLDQELRIAGIKGVTAQSMIIGGVLTPAIVKLTRPELRDAPPAAVAAALEEEAARGGGSALMRAPAGAVGEAIVRAIGKGGPVVTPYWGHALVEALFLDPWWPPSLARAVHRAMTKNMIFKLQQQGKKAA